ncbi:transposase [Candidatus Poribacteria bacterium]|nr:MAG: transposase [Candidatus Poribacteria bacterium]
MKTYKYELSHQSNTIQLGNLLDDLHQVHVHVIRLQRRYYRLFGKYISASTMNAHIAKLKKRTKPHWKQLPSQVVQDVVLRIDKGYQKFFQNIKDRNSGKTTKKVGRPHIKPRHKFNSMTWTQAGYKIEGNRFYISCLKKWFTFWKHREWTGTIKTVTIKRDPVGDYSISLVCADAEPIVPLPLTGNVAGIDFGLKTFLTLSDGTRIASPQFFKQGLNALRSAHKALSRKQFLSGGWFHAKRHLARSYKDIANRRRDWFWKTAKSLCEKYDTLVVETLNLDAMKRLWGRKVSDLAFGEFVLILKWQCHKYGKSLVQIGTWTPTTKVCHICSHQHTTLTLADRTWTCDCCHTHHDRDINATNVILKAGMPA